MKGGMEMDTTAKHLLIEYHGCDKELLDDKDRLERLLRYAAEKAGATVVGVIFHTFSPQGVSGVVVVEESHFSIHTWPEYRYAAVDCYTCGDCEPHAAHDYLKEELSATETELMILDRGQSPPRPSIKMAAHRINELCVEHS
jgi:S-adenosylmethionine decarboxylase proenzyme